MSEFGLDPFVAGVILALAVATFATKVGGLWVLSRIEVSDRVEAGLSLLPGAIVVSILGPELVEGGPAEWSAAALVLVVAWKTENVLLAIVVGAGAVVAFRGVL